LNNNTLFEKENFVIDNQEDWNSLLEKMNDNSSINFLEFSSSVDFNNYLALASFDKFDCTYPSCNTLIVPILHVIQLPMTLRLFMKVKKL